MQNKLFQFMKNPKIRKYYRIEGKSPKIPEQEQNQKDSDQLKKNPKPAKISRLKNCINQYFSKV